ncbi:MAG: winged helix-turn-helix transcriptional regulator [Desulfobacteraceae bacterium]|nr:winged helix-turn-helix transcriptional regulator [Desulfobacteraceae bacterium]
MAEVNKKLKEQVSHALDYTEALRREIHAEIPPQQILIFLLVAMDQGLGQNEIASTLIMHEGTVSRNIARLGQRKHKTADGKIETVGYGLIETRQDDYDDIRKKCVYLTDKGLEILTRLMKKLYKEEKGDSAADDNNDQRKIPS